MKPNEHASGAAMRLTAIGTGAAAPSRTRVNAGYLLESGGARVLLDCGSGVVHRMASLGVDWRSITHVVLTHFHADHVSDVPTLLVAWRYGQLPPRADPVVIVGPPGTRAMLERLAAALWPSLLEPGFPVEVREVEPEGETELDAGLRLRARKVQHTDESVAYSVERGGRRVVYTGDTGPDPELGAWAAGCDVLLAECSLPSSMAVPNHLTPEGAAELAAAARPGVLVLTHFYPPVEQVDVRAVVARQFAGRVELAHDGWRITLPAAG